ncbi:MAG: S41 family peptidase [Candidatus Sumerlaeia bacterium]
MAKSTKRAISKLGTLEGRLLMMCLALVFAGGFFVLKMPAQIAAMEEQRKSSSELHDFAELYAEIYSQIKTRYVDEIDSKKLFEGSINGMMGALDPHSSWMPPAVQEQLTRDTEGEYSGVGLEITTRDGVLTVVSPLPGSPAARVGVMPWDRIIEIDGKTTEKIQLQDAVKALTGPTGTKVKIKVWREGKNQPLDFEITRETVHIISVFSKILDGGIGYIRIARFQEDTAKEVRKALENFNANNVAGVVVDLRNDAGGLLDKCVEICNFFLPEGQVIVSIKGRNPADNRKYLAVEDQLCAQPLVVLVNRGSASASEIFAGAMQDTKRGLIIGPDDARNGKVLHTFGKGSVQTISPLKYSLDREANGDMKPSGLRLTTARYYTPSGKPILADKGDGHSGGITPDVGVKLPPNHEAELILRGGLMGEFAVVEPGKELRLPSDTDETTSPEERQAPKTDDSKTTLSLFERLTNGSAKTTAAKKPSEPFRDIQLDESIKYLKAMIVARSSGQMTEKPEKTEKK